MHGRDKNGCHIMFIGASDEEEARCEIAHGLSKSGEASFPPEIRDLNQLGCGLGLGTTLLEQGSATTRYLHATRAIKRFTRRQQTRITAMAI